MPHVKSQSLDYSSKPTFAGISGDHNSQHLWPLALLCSIHVLSVVLTLQNNKTIMSWGNLPPLPVKTWECLQTAEFVSDCPLLLSLVWLHSVLLPLRTLGATESMSSMDLSYRWVVGNTRSTLWLADGGGGVETLTPGLTRELEIYLAFSPWSRQSVFMYNLFWFWRETMPS